MKIIHLASSDINGGAAIAAHRVVSAQQKSPKLDSKFLVRSKKSDYGNIFSTQISSSKKIISGINFILDEILIRSLTKKSRGRFTFPYLGENVVQNILVRNADIINLHWINGGFLSLKSLKQISKLDKPVVWTQHDMWAFTGGCHYTAECEKFVSQCSNCPSLVFRFNHDFSNTIFLAKKEIFANLNLTIVTSSNWLAREASRSSLFMDKSVIVIPTPLNTDTFIPQNKKLAREKLELPAAKKIILTGAMNLNDERKGFSYLIAALNIIKESKNNLNEEIELAVFGKLDENVLSKIPFKVHQLGKLKNENEIVMAYNSADVYVAPSLEDNLPNTVMEAMSCSVPVVAFNVGGIPDMIDDGQNGILSELRSVNELAEGIKLVLTNEELHKRFSVSAREKVLKNFNQKVIAEKYLEVYKSVLL